MFMMLTSRPAGTPLKILMFLKTLSAGSFSRPAMERRTKAAPLSRRAAVTLSRTRRAESVSGILGPPGPCALGILFVESEIAGCTEPDGDGLLVAVIGVVAQA